MSYIGTTKIGKMFLGTIEIAKAYLGTTLVFQKEGNLPYTPVQYIVTDGHAYIVTGKAGTPPKSSEIKVMCPTDANYGLLCAWTNASGSDARNFGLAKAYQGKKMGMTFYYNYGAGDGIPSIEYSVDNQTPFIVKTSIKKGAQSISIKQANSDSWTTVNKAGNYNVSSTYQLVILNAYQGGSYSLPAPSGTRIYYCKIYSDANFTTLLFDGVPCYYQGAFGLWDRVSNSFKGSSNQNGTFYGPSNL